MAGSFLNLLSFIVLSEVVVSERYFGPILVNINDEQDLAVLDVANEYSVSNSLLKYSIPFFSRDPQGKRLIRSSALNKFSVQPVKHFLMNYDAVITPITSKKPRRNPAVSVLVYTPNIFNDKTTKSRTSIDCILLHVIDKKSFTKVGESVCEFRFYNKLVCITRISLLTKLLKGSKEKFQLSIFYENGTNCAASARWRKSRKLPSRNLTLLKQFTIRSSKPKPQVIQRINADRKILIEVPGKEYSPGDSFVIPVSVQPGSSNVVRITIRLHATGPLRISEMRPTADNWKVSSVTKFNVTSATSILLSARRLRKSRPSSSERIAEIFMQVLSPRDILFRKKYERNARLRFTVQYRKKARRSSRRDSHTRGPQTRRGSRKKKRKPKWRRAQFNIRLTLKRVSLSTTFSSWLCPIQQREFYINTAVLTGVKEAHPLRIFEISKASTAVRDVVGSSSCYSRQPAVVKVSPDCSSVYFDGTESEASSGATIVVKKGPQQFTTFNVSVYVPRKPLKILLNDDKLNLIRGWKVPVDSEPFKRSGSSSRNERTRLTPRNNSSQQTCRLRYQETPVRVAAQFYTESPDMETVKVYPTTETQYFDVTSMVRISVRNSDVVQLVNNAIPPLIRGLNRGQTEIQVRSQHTDILLASKDITVTNSKVSLRRVSGLLLGSTKFSLKPDVNDSSISVLNININESINNLQKRPMFVLVEYSDDSRVPLTQLLSAHYSLKVKSLNKQVIGVVKPVSLSDTIQLSKMPVLKPKRKGSGEIVRLTLELPPKCQQKEMHPLAVTYLFVNISTDLKKKRLKSRSRNLLPVIMSSTQTPMPTSVIKTAPVTTVAINGSTYSGSDELKIADGSGTHAELYRASQRTESKSENLNAGLGTGTVIMLAFAAILLIVGLAFGGNLIMNSVRRQCRYRRQFRRYLEAYKHSLSSLGSLDDDSTDGEDYDGSQWMGRGWVYLDGERCTRVIAVKEQRLMSDEQFNSMQRQSPASTSTCSRISLSPGAGTLYKGQECSIRITPNPLMPQRQSTLSKSAFSLTQDDRRSLDDLTSYDDEIEVFQDDYEDMLTDASEDEMENKSTVSVEDQLSAIGPNRLREYLDGLKESVA